MDDDRQLKYVTEIAKLDLNYEKFKKQIQLFSQYLSYSNKDYLYNETYLSNFCMDFINYIKYIKKKSPIFAKIVNKIVDYSEIMDIQLSMDQYWIYHSQKGSLKVNKNIDLNEVCKDKVLIRVMILYNNDRHLFIKEYKLKKQKDFLDKVVTEIWNEILQWIEGINNDKFTR